MIKFVLRFITLASLILIPNSQLHCKTKALVIGISHYQDPSIMDLQWPRRDAEHYAANLKNNKSIRIEELDFQLITNAQASSYQIMIALDRLFDAVHKGDSVFLFFSGYGKISTNTQSIPPQLYFYDTPYSVSEINPFDLFGRVIEMANLLDIQYSIVANISPIYFPPEFSKENLAVNSKSASEKIASNTLCLNTMTASYTFSDYEKQTKAKSSFTEFLLKALLGSADEDKNGLIKWSELKNYFNEQTDKSLSSQGLLCFSCSSKKFISPVAVDQIYFEPASNWVEPVFVDDQSVLANPKLLAQPDSVQLLVKDFILSVKLGHLLLPQKNNALERCEKLLANPEINTIHNEIKRILIAAFLDESQQAINLYLSSDNQELVKRLNGTKSYEVYPAYLKQVQRFMPSTHYLANQINSKLNYFEGLNLRFEAKPTKDSSKLNESLHKQFKALSYEPASSYIYNEIGILYQLLNNEILAVEHFQKAAEHSPNWSLPYVNLAKMFIETEPLKALRIAKHAKLLSPNSSFTQNLLGVCYMEVNEYIPAETSLMKAIELNRDNYQAYYNLACLRALQSKNNEAISYLEKAFQKGFDEIDHAMRDKDLIKIRSLEKWENLIKQYFGSLPNQKNK